MNHYTLPQSVQSEIYNLSSVVSDVAIDYLCGILEDLDLSISSVSNYDFSLVIHAEQSNKTTIEIRIDRIARIFEIVAIQDNYVILPCRGSWNDILLYLERLLDGM